MESHYCPRSERAMLRKLYQVKGQSSWQVWTKPLLSKQNTAARFAQLHLNKPTTRLLEQNRRGQGGDVCPHSKENQTNFIWKDSGVSVGPSVPQLNLGTGQWSEHSSKSATVEKEKNRDLTEMLCMMSAAKTNTLNERKQFLVPGVWNWKVFLCGSISIRTD